VTEAEWLKCDDAEMMLKGLQGKASVRKLRLFACACCRRIGDFLPTDACLRGLEIAERYVDGRATNQERSSARSAVIASAEEEGLTLFDSYEQESIEWGTIPGGSAFLAIVELLGGREFEAARVASDAALEAAWDASRLRNGEEAARIAFEEDYSTERAAQALILRDILGNPFRPVSLGPAWLTWNDGTVPTLAQAIYDDRAFDRLSVLADALEEAGCQDADILDHCRSGGEHVRGCWVVDALLDKS